MSEDETATPSTPKVDPETLVIRARPARAIRFRRGAIIGIAALGSTSLVAVAWVALKPTAFRHVVEQQELPQPNSRPATDALNGLPSSYGDAPKLGPPLPGDLGKPILDHQRSLETANDTSAQQLEQAEAAERDHRAAELKQLGSPASCFRSGRRPLRPAPPRSLRLPPIRSRQQAAARLRSTLSAIRMPKATRPSSWPRSTRRGRPTRTR